MAGLLTAGCSGVAFPDLNFSGRSRPFVPGNHVDAGPLPAEIRRVVVLPLHSEVWNAPDLAAVETSFIGELGKYQRFELAPVARAALATRFAHESLSSSAALPAEFLSWLRREFAADAVLFLDLTHYAPYQPVALGVRAKLVATTDGRPLWSCDSLFDAAQADVAEAARIYQAGVARPTHPVETSASTLQSPARFAKYVAHAVFGTLPPRQTR